MRGHRAMAFACGVALAIVGTAQPAVAAKPSGVDVSAMDRTVRPGDDFDAFASGAWRARTVIPPDRQEVGSVEDLTASTRERLRLVIEAGAARPRTHDAKLIGDLYAAFMDEARVEAAGDAPLRRDLARLTAVSDKSAMAAYMGRTQGGFGRGFFFCDVWVDLKAPTRPALRLRTAGLGLDYREFYGDPETVNAYRDYVRRTLELVGWPDAAGAARAVVDMELRVAEGSWTIAETGDRIKRYNPMSLSELQALAPGFDWPAYFRGAGVEGVDPIFVQQKSAMPKIAAVYADAPLETLKAWAAFQLADRASPYLSKRFVDNRFSFRGKLQQGLDHEEPRWKRAVQAVDESLPHALGHEYVERYFPPQSRAAVQAMVVNFKAAMAQRIQALDWMTPSTKAYALDKLARVRVLVGHPRRWRDYSALNLDRGDLYGSMRRVLAFNWSAERAKLGRPADPDEWFLSPQTVDGFSDQARLTIGVPAAILQPPFFDPAADPAANYGALGELIGHELTHQFDDQGRKYGVAGIHDWWAPADAARFEQAAARLAAQYGAIEVMPGVKLNGRQTLTENIADLGGLLLALDAYHLSLGGRPAPVIDGLTGDQRVFLAWAGVFRAKLRDESLKSQALSGTHTPFKFRAIGPMRNIDAWYSAFGVQPGDRYHLPPDERVRIW